MASNTESWSQIEQQFPESNFLQSPSWAQMNQLIGHKTIIEDFEGAGWCLMIVKDAKRGRYLEIPGGPLIDWADSELTRRVFAKIRSIAKQEKCVFIRLRPQLYHNAKNIALLSELGCKKAPMHLHAEHTVMLDLTQAEDKLLSSMRRQTRYEVRRSLKQGISVEWQNDEAIFTEFQRVQTITAQRQGFIPPDLKTLLAEREAFGENIRIYVAKTAGTQGSGCNKSNDSKNPNSPDGPNNTNDTKDQSEPIAYGLVLWSGQEAEYFEAASTDLNRKLPGAYALQWQVIKDMKALGLKRYNLWGIAPQGVKNHRYSGVTTFKTGFGGEIVEFVPAQDIIISKSKYLKDWAIETVRRKTRNL